MATSASTPAMRRHAAHDGHDAHAHDGSSAAGEEPDAHGHEGGPPHESPWVVTVPLILLALPSIYAGWMYIEPMLFGGWFGDSIFVREPHAVVAELKDEWHGAFRSSCMASRQPPFWLAVAGIAARRLPVPGQPGAAGARSQRGFAPSTRCSTTSTTSTASTTGFSPVARAASAASRPTSATGRSSTAFSSTARRSSSASVSGVFRRIQSGYVYHYAFVMIVGVFGLLYWWGVR